MRDNAWNNYCRFGGRLHTFRIVAVTTLLLVIGVSIAFAQEECSCGCGGTLPNCGCTGCSEGSSEQGTPSNGEVSISYSSEPQSSEETPYSPPEQQYSPPPQPLSCPSRAAENMVLVGGMPPNCEYNCGPGYHMNDALGICDPNICPDRPQDNLIAIPNTYPVCQWQCKDGYGMNEGGTCTPCAEICKKDNEIPDPTQCVGGKCGCTCDFANGYRYNDQGVCVNDLENALKNSKDTNATALALIPYLKDDNSTVRLLALTGLCNLPHLPTQPSVLQALKDAIKETCEKYPDMKQLISNHLWNSGFSDSE